MKEERKRLEEHEYMGNIWGWKVSFISLAVILILFGIMAIRYCTMDPEDRQQPVENIEIIGK